MRRFLIATALLLPTVAEATSFNIKNCSVLTIDISVFRADGGSSMWTMAEPGETKLLQCMSDGCKLQIIYKGAAPSAGNFPGPYRDDRCTRGVADIASGGLPAAGNCGC